MRTRLLSILSAAALAAAVPTPAAAQPAVGAVYTMTNAADGNAVVTYLRAPDGSLQWAGHTPTGGDGTGAGLGNQGGLALSNDGRWLFVVNAGSNTLTVFEVRHDELRWVDTASTGGSLPVSVTTDGALVYVVHAGTDDISGFRQAEDGTLNPIPGSRQALSATGAGPAQIGFSPDGRLLVVAEKNTNVLSVFPVSRDGVAGVGVAHASSGPTPFGFGFGRRGQLFVSEAFGGAPNISAVSSYLADASGPDLLQVISPSVPTNQLAACWIAVARSGKLVYAANAASNSVSGYSVSAGGEITLLDPDGVTATTGAGPVDTTLSGDGRYLHVLNGGDATISTFTVGAKGQLTLVDTVAAPAGANGLAAR